MQKRTTSKILLEACLAILLIGPSACHNPSESSEEELHKQGAEDLYQPGASVEEEKLASQTIKGPHPPAGELTTNMVQDDEEAAMADDLISQGVEFYSYKGTFQPRNKKLEIDINQRLYAVRNYIDLLQDEGYFDRDKKLTEDEKYKLETFITTIKQQVKGLSKQHSEELKKTLDKYLLMLLLKKYSIINNIPKDGLATHVSQRLKEINKEQKKTGAFRDFFLSLTFLSENDYRMIAPKIEDIHKKLESSLIKCLENKKTRKAPQATKERLAKMYQENRRLVKRAIEIEENIAMLKASKDTYMMYILQDLEQLNTELNGIERTIKNLQKDKKDPGKRR